MLRYLSKVFLCMALYSSAMHADSLGPTTFIGFAVTSAYTPTCFRFSTNQFIVILNKSSSTLGYYIYTADGTLVTSGTLPFAGEYSSCCYNNQDDTVLVVYQNTSRYFCALLSGDMSQVLVAPREIMPWFGVAAGCAYNSRDNEFIITSHRFSGGGKILYMTIDASGTTVVPLTEVTGSANVSGSIVSFASYNSAANQYVISWIQQGSPNKAAFTVINADGASSIDMTLIPTASSNIFSGLAINSYNSAYNQYIITWSDESNNGYFAIYDALGAVVVPETHVTNDTFVFIQRGMYVSYNRQNNEYLISWITVNDPRVPTMRFYNAQGQAVTSEITLDISGGKEAILTFSSCYNPITGTFFTVYDNYYAIYTRTPFISAISSVTGQRLLNRFANYGQYFKRLSWTPSAASDLMSYNVYKNGVLIAAVPPYTTSYDDNSVVSSVATLYEVSALTSTGYASLLASVYA